VELDRRLWAIDLKASQNVGATDLRGFKSFETFYGKPVRKVIGYWGEAAKKLEDVDILPWQTLLREMGL
jgi:hypothetical protein